MRLITNDILSIDELGLPKTVTDFANYPHGLVLVTGPTSSGKSSTLASIIDKINTEQSKRIITAEDPIEFVHKHKRSSIVQREVNYDTHSFANALKSSLRQDPDIILVGEMRDLETISAAITAAENRPSSLLDPPHQFGCPDNQPYHRRLPTPSTVPSQHSAEHLLKSCLLAKIGAHHCRRTGAGNWNSD